MKTEDRIKLFINSHSLLESELDKVEKKLHLDLKRFVEVTGDEDYYPQFDYNLRMEAELMGKHYEVFYCLEKHIRKLISETLEAEHGETWWENCVPEPVNANVLKNKKKEIDSGFTVRSMNDIDYTTFGELGEIVRTNWESFDSIFSSQSAFNKIMTSLNTLRSPIAHCSPLADDEVVRLHLTLRDWFRLME